MRVDYRDVTEFDLHRFCVEASTLGLAPGVVPKYVETDIGNKQPFFLSRIDEQGTMIYAQSLGCTMLHILND